MILVILKQKGFGSKWCCWVKQILSSATSSVLLDGVSGPQFKCGRGVRQEDPVFLLLFVSTADFLQTILNNVMHAGLHQRPLAGQSCPEFPILQYADDSLTIEKVSSLEFTHLKQLGDILISSSRLIVNHRKSSMMPIKCVS